MKNGDASPPPRNGEASASLEEGLQEGASGEAVSDNERWWLKRRAEKRRQLNSCDDPEQRKELEAAIARADVHLQPREDHLHSPATDDFPDLPDFLDRRVA